MLTLPGRDRIASLRSLHKYDPANNSPGLFAVPLTPFDAQSGKDRQTDIYTKIDRWRDSWIDRWIDKYDPLNSPGLFVVPLTPFDAQSGIDKHIDRQIDRWTDRWTDRQV